MRQRLLEIAGFVVSAAAAIALATPPAWAVINNPIGIDCNTPGDTFGAWVAGGGDYNGDGFADFAYGAPCAGAGELEQAGRAFVRSGRGGGSLLKLAGTQLNGFLGARISFVGDLTGDNRDEVAIASPLFDVLDISRPDIVLVDGGKVDIYTQGQKTPIMTLFGNESGGFFGISVAGIEDINGDGVRDLAVGASGERKPLQQKRGGAVHLISGADGTFLQSIYGDKSGQKLGLSIANLGSHDGDAMDELLVTAFKSPVGGVEESGYFEVRQTALFEGPEMYSTRGARKDRLGEASDADAEDGSFIVGAPGRKLDGLKDTGIVSAYHADGTRAFEVADTIAQKEAGFGSSVAAIGDINDDGVIDFAASAPRFDSLPSQEEGFLVDVGRISVLSGLAGAPIWTAEGQVLAARFGTALAGGIDYNRDGVPDLITGNPGDAPSGRRGGGSVKILSGVDGSELDRFVGKRGVETRIFTYGNAPTARARAYDPFGNARGMNARILAGAAGDELSIAIIGEAQGIPEAGAIRVALGTGKGGSQPIVAVLNATKRRKIDSKFSAASALGGYQGGVTVGGGDLLNNGEQKLVVGTADTPQFGPRVAVFRELDAGSTDFDGWLLDNFFPVFTRTDTIDTGIDGVVTPVRINANGVNIAVGNLAPSPGQEIVVAPIDGLPVVRVFSSEGVGLTRGDGEPLQWLAYNTVDRSGVSIAIADLDGDGKRQIITAPMTGPPLVRAFEGNGVPFTAFGAQDPVAFTAAGFSGGLRVAAADVDFDGRQEIIVIGSVGGEANKIRAFEADGTPVKGFSNIRPYPGGSNGTTIAATDRLVRR